MISACGGQRGSGSNGWLLPRWVRLNSSTRAIWGIEEKGRALTRFVQQLTELRERYPILRRSRFLTGEYDEELVSRI